jgi:uncharacterized protein (DUF433 family)
MNPVMKKTTRPLKIVKEVVPLRVDSGGAIRIGNTRVTLDTVVTAFNQGYAAEEIVSKFPVLDLADVYAVISYYLRRQQEIDAYLAQEDATIRQQYPNMFATKGIRERLLTRRAEHERLYDVKVPC